MCYKDEAEGGKEMATEKIPPGLFRFLFIFITIITSILTYVVYFHFIIVYFK